MCSLFFYKYNLDLTKFMWSFCKLKFYYYKILVCCIIKVELFLKSCKIKKERNKDYRNLRRLFIIYKINNR